jgi:hypothetical protein
MNHAPAFKGAVVAYQPWPNGEFSAAPVGKKPVAFTGS